MVNSNNVICKLQYTTSNTVPGGSAGPWWPCTRSRWTRETLDARSADPSEPREHDILHIYIFATAVAWHLALRFCVKNW